MKYRKYGVLIEHTEGTGKEKGFSFYKENPYAAKKT